MPLTRSSSFQESMPANFQKMMSGEYYSLSNFERKLSGRSSTNGDLARTIVGTLTHYVFGISGSTSSGELARMAERALQKEREQKQKQTRLMSDIAPEGNDRFESEVYAVQCSILDVGDIIR